MEQIETLYHPIRMQLEHSTIPAKDAERECQANLKWATIYK